MTPRTPPDGTRVLVTGAAGRIGTAVVRDLLDHGRTVTALVQEPTDEMPQTGPRPDRVVVGDARDPAVVADAIRGADAVVHLAAIPHPSYGTTFEVYATNTAATWAVLSTAGERGVPRVVLASSINASGIPMNPHRPLPAYYPIDEDLPHDVADPYSLSKQADEAAAAAATRAWGTTTVCLRFPFTAPRDVLLDTVSEFAAHPGDHAGTGWSYLDVRDAARAVRASLTAPLSGTHVVGLAADDTMFTTPTAELVAAHAPGVPLRRAVTGNSALVDTRRAAELLGFRPRFSLHADL